MSSKEIGIEQARKILGDLARAAENGQITYLTIGNSRRRVAAIVPINRIKETTMTSYTLTIVRGEDRGVGNGVDLAAEDSPIQYGDLPDEVTDWLEANGFNADHPDHWVLVTPADEDPAAVNVIAQRVIDDHPKEGTMASSNITPRPGGPRGGRPADHDPDRLIFWEAELLGVEGTPADQARWAEEEERARQAHAQRVAEEEAAEAARRERFPMLHGDVQHVELNDVWPLLADMGRRTWGAGDVEILAEVAGGAAKRLAAGVRSLRERRDGNTRLHVQQDGHGRVIVTWWSFGGCFRTDRAWWAQAHLDLRGDEYGELRRVGSRIPTVIAVAGAAGHTVFTDSDSGPLEDVVAAAWDAWEGRWGRRDRAGFAQPETPETALPLEEFLAELAEHRQRDE